MGSETIKLKLSMIGNRVKEALSLFNSSQVVNNVSGPSSADKANVGMPSLKKKNSISEASHVATDSPGSHFIRRTSIDLPAYTLNEILCHDTMDDCWVVIYDRVYDLTNFLQEHPGGEWVLLDYAGRDATLAFRGVGHSKMAERSLQPFLIGEVADSDRLWLFGNSDVLGI